MKIGTAIFAFDTHGNFLMHQRSNPTGNGKWSVFGGQVESGETPAQAANREFTEETGLTVTALSEIAVTIAEYPDGDTWETHWFTGQTSGEPRLSEESSACRWVSWNNMPEPLWQPHYNQLLGSFVLPPAEALPSPRRVAPLKKRKRNDS